MNNPFDGTGEPPGIDPFTGLPFRSQAADAAGVPILTDTRPLTGLAASQRGSAIRLEPGQNGIGSLTPPPPIRVAQMLRRDGDCLAEAVVVILGLSLLPPSLGDPVPLNNSEPMDLTARLTWGIGNVTFTCDVDWENGKVIGLFAETITVDVLDVTVAPFVGTIPAIQVSAAFAYGRPQGEGGAKRTVTFGVNGGGVTLIKIPPFATSLTLQSKGNATPSMFLSFMTDTGPRQALCTVEHTKTSSTSFVAIDIPNNARYISVSNGGAFGESCQAIFALSL